jgi:hypothetical protein
MLIEQILGWSCLVAAVAAIGVYVWLVVARAQLIRLMTGLGLFLTGLALFQGPNILAKAEGETNVKLALAALIVAVAVQIVAALRTRPSWTGVERRSGTGEVA